MLQKGARKESLQEPTSDERCDVGLRQYSVSLLQPDANTRNSSGDEIANVNFLYDDMVHLLQNTIDSCINSATDRRSGYVAITPFKVIQGHQFSYQSKAHIRLPISD